MDTLEITTLIDEALDRFKGRDLVSGAEVVDFLLDLRLCLPDPDAAIAELLGEEAEPVA